MQFKVRLYETMLNTHICIDNDGHSHRIDLMVDGAFPKGTDPESLVGKTIECEYTYPYISIAMGVREVTNEDS